MKKRLFFLMLAGLLVATPALAAVSVNSGPTPLASPITAKASSAPVVLFSVSLSQTAGETLSSVSVNLANNATSTASGSDLASVAVYKDNGDGTFNSSTDLVAGSQTLVNIGSPTMVNTTVNNTINSTSTAFFVTLRTSATWSDAAPADSVVVGLPAEGIVTSANSPVVTAATTSPITADTTLPVITIDPYITVPVNADITVTASTNEGTLNATSHTFTENGSFDFVATDAAGNVRTVTVTITNIDRTLPAFESAVAMNSGGTDAKEAGDSVVLTFSEATNGPVITAANIGAVLLLNNSHSFLDGAGLIGTSTWNGSRTVLTIVLSASSSVPSVAVGDTVSIGGNLIEDLAGNPVLGTQTITGTFGGSVIAPGDGDCTNSLKNGRLYRIEGSDTVYLAAACRLKEFKGKAVGHAKGKKFQNIITLSTMPAPGNPIGDDEDDDEDGEEGDDDNDSDTLQAVSLTNVEQDKDAEREALKVFTKLFKKLPRNGFDWETLHYLTYGGVLTTRNIQKERGALKIYAAKFRALPKADGDWLAVHALAYRSN